MSVPAIGKSQMKENSFSNSSSNDSKYQKKHPAEQQRQPAHRPQTTPSRQPSQQSSSSSKKPDDRNLQIRKRASFTNHRETLKDSTAASSSSINSLERTPRNNPKFKSKFHSQTDVRIKKPSQSKLLTSTTIKSHLRSRPSHSQRRASGEASKPYNTRHNPKKSNKALLLSSTKGAVATVSQEASTSKTEQDSHNNPQQHRSRRKLAFMEKGDDNSQPAFSTYSGPENDSDRNVPEGQSSDSGRSTPSKHYSDSLPGQVSTSSSRPVAPLSLRRQIALALELSKDENKTDSALESTGQTEPVKTIKNKQFLPQHRNNKGETELHLAAIRNDYAKIEQILKQHTDEDGDILIDVNVKDFAGWTPLHEACIKGHTQTVRVLVTHGANVNVISEDGTTPLIDASTQGHLSIVKLLLKHGANPLVLNKKGQNSIDSASSSTIENLLKSYVKTDNKLSEDKDDKRPINKEPKDDHHKKEELAPDSSTKAKRTTDKEDRLKAEHKTHEDKKSKSHDKQIVEEADSGNSRKAEDATKKLSVNRPEEESQKDRKDTASNSAKKDPKSSKEDHRLDKAKRDSKDDSRKTPSHSREHKKVEKRVELREDSHHSKKELNDPTESKDSDSKGDTSVASSSKTTGKKLEPNDPKKASGKGPSSLSITRPTVDPSSSLKASTDLQTKSSDSPKESAKSPDADARASSQAICLPSNLQDFDQPNTSACSQLTVNTANKAAESLDNSQKDQIMPSNMEKMSTTSTANIVTTTPTVALSAAVTVSPPASSSSNANGSQTVSTAQADSSQSNNPTATGKLSVSSSNSITNSAVSVTQSTPVTASSTVSASVVNSTISAPSTGASTLSTAMPTSAPATMPTTALAPSLASAESSVLVPVTQSSPAQTLNNSAMKPSQSLSTVSSPPQSSSCSVKSPSHSQASFMSCLSTAASSTTSSAPATSLSSTISTSVSQSAASPVNTSSNLSQNVTSSQANPVSQQQSSVQQSKASGSVTSTASVSVSHPSSTPSSSFGTTSLSSSTSDVSIAPITSTLPITLPKSGDPVKGGDLNVHSTDSLSAELPASTQKEALPSKESKPELDSSMKLDSQRMLIDPDSMHTKSGDDRHHPLKDEFAPQITNVSSTSQPTALSVPTSRAPESSSASGANTAAPTTNTTPATAPSLGTGHHLRGRKRRRDDQSQADKSEGASSKKSKEHRNNQNNNASTAHSNDGGHTTEDEVVSDSGSAHQSEATLKVPPIRIVINTHDQNREGSANNTHFRQYVINQDAGSDDAQDSAAAGNSAGNAAGATQGGPNSAPSTRITRSSHRVALQQQKHSDLDDHGSSGIGTRKKKTRALRSALDSERSTITGNINSAGNYSQSNSPLPADKQNSNSASMVGHENDENSSSSTTSTIHDLSMNPNLYNYKPENSSAKMFLSIRDHVDRRRRIMERIAPQKYPDHFDDFLTMKRNYMLQSNVESMQAETPLPPPSTLSHSSPLYHLFQEQERERHRMRLRHQVEREKMKMTAEQEYFRVHCRAAHANAGQNIPLSVTAFLKDEELNNLLEFESDNGQDNIIVTQLRADDQNFLNHGPSGMNASARIKCNGRVLLKWKSDVEDKWNRSKVTLINRQRMEAESLASTQRLNWQWKLNEIAEAAGTPQTNLNLSMISFTEHEDFVPMIRVCEEFDLFPV